MKINKTGGFTLIEVMVVVVILGVLASIIVPNVIGRADQAKIIKAKQDILAIENALEMYRLDNGFYPTNDQGLMALIKRPETEPVPSAWREGGYLKQLRKDPWERDYQYLNPGIHKEIDIFSYGKEGRPDEQNEIGNWNLDEKK